MPLLLLFSNFGSTQLAGPITSIATTANLISGGGAEFPTPANGEYFVLEFNDAATGDLFEIVHVTNVTGDTITMVRGQEGTDALPWSAGDLVYCGPTAGQQALFQQSVAFNGNPNGNVAGSAGSATSPPTLCWNSATGGYWYCTVSGNAASATWAPLFTESFLDDTGTVNTVTVAFPTAPSSLSELIGVPFYVKKSNSPSTGAIVLNANSLGNIDCTMVDTTPFNATLNWPANAIGIVAYDGTAFRVLNFLAPGVFNPTPAPVYNAAAQVVNGTTIEVVGVNGGFVWIQGYNYPVPGGLTLSNSGLSASTAYYLYVFINAGVVEAEFSATGYTIASNGIPQKTGDPSRTLIAIVGTTSGVLFADSGANRLVCNWLETPGGKLAKNHYTADRSTSSTSWVEVNTEIRLNFVTLGNRNTDFYLSGEFENVGGANSSIYVAIAVDSNSAPQNDLGTGAATTFTGGTPPTGTPTGIDGAVVLNEGLHFATVLAATFSGSGTVSMGGGTLSVGHTIVELGAKIYG